MTLVTTALLTIIVFHLSQEDALPAVGYLVKADLYFMAAYVLTFCLIMESIAINRLQKNGHELLAKKIDRHFARVILPCTVLSLIYFVVTTIL